VTTVEYCIYRTCQDEYFPNVGPPYPIKVRYGNMKTFATLDEASKYPYRPPKGIRHSESSGKCCVFDLKLTKTWKYLGNNETVVETKVSWV